MNKKGQLSEGRTIASLILVIAILMILYILFIPPQARDDLLGPTDINFNDSDRDGRGRLELLSQSPGLVSPTREFGIVHQIPSVNLFVKSEPKVFSLAQSLSVKNGLFTKAFPSTSFDVDDADLKRVALVFSVRDPSGELRLSLNGNQFYAEDLEASGVKVIEIPLNLIRNRNTLDFEVSSPGLAFWKTNKYALSDVTLREEFERINSQESRQFTITSDEKDSLESAELSYFQFCNLRLPDQTTTLRIYLNDESVFSGLTRCISTKQTHEVDIADLNSGTNDVRFVLENGDFTLNEIKLETISDEAKRPTYTFSLSKKQFEDIQDGDRDIYLEMFFEEQERAKRARVTVNEADIILNTEENSFEYNLEDDVERGTNFIRISPSNTFNIVGLKVVLD